MLAKLLQNSRKSEAQRVESGVAYKKMCSLNDSNSCLVWLLVNGPHSFRSRTKFSIKSHLELPDHGCHCYVEKEVCDQNYSSEVNY